MSTIRPKRIRTPVKCHLCSEHVRKGHQWRTKAKVRETIEHTDILDYRSIPEMSVSEAPSHSEELCSSEMGQSLRLSAEDNRAFGYLDRSSNSEEHTSTLNEKTLVSPLEDYTPVPSVTLFDSHLSESLGENGFTIDPELNEIYASDWRAEMRIKYHGMGHCQVIGINPRLHGTERCYFVGIVGGNNAYEYEDNERAFRRIGQLGTHYYTVNEILTLISTSADREINLADSAPLEQGHRGIEISSGYFEVTPITNT